MGMIKLFFDKITAFKLPPNQIEIVKAQLKEGSEFFTGIHSGSSVPELLCFSVLPVWARHDYPCFLI